MERGGPSTEKRGARVLSATSESLSRGEPMWLITASVVFLAAVAGAVALMYTRPVMVPFVLSIFITYLVSPLVDFLRVQWRFPKALAVLVTLLVVAGLLTLLGLLIFTSTQSLLQNVDVYRERIIAWVQRATGFLDRTGLDLGQQDLIQAVQQLPILTWVQRSAGTAVGLVTNGVLVLIFVIYLLLGRHPNQLRTGFYAEIDLRVRRYIVVKVATSAATGLLTGIILSAFRLELALVFGVMAFLLNFIPSIGSVVATLLPLPVALIQFNTGLPIVGVIVLPGAVQFTIGNIVEPLVMGEGLDLHPVTILVSLLFWGLLWGVVGMLLAAPITAVLRIVFSQVEFTKPVADLMAGRLPRGGAVTGEMRVPAELEPAPPTPSPTRRVRGG